MIHASSKPSFPSFFFFGKRRRTSCNFSDTRNLNGNPGDVFEDPSFYASATAALASAPAARSSAAAGVPPLSERRDWLREDELACVTDVPSIPQPRLVKSLPTVELPSLVEDIYSRRFVVEPSKGNVSALQFEKISLRRQLISKPKCFPVQDLRLKQCRGSEKSSLGMQSTTLRHRSLLLAGVIEILRLLMRGLP